MDHPDAPRRRKKALDKLKTLSQSYVNAEVKIAIIDTRRSKTPLEGKGSHFSPAFH